MRSPRAPHRPRVGTVAAATVRTLLLSAVLSAHALAAELTPQEIGDQVSGRLFASLMTTLQEKIATEGPEAAIAYCRLEALPLTAQVAAEFPQVKSVRRTALRVRNPANAPDPTDRTVLERWLASWNPATPPPAVSEEFTTPDGTKELRYYRPVPVMATCLACHGTGDEIPANVRRAIERDYPQDQAVNFQESDLRGAIVVTFDAE
ncbi:MAG: DUF3365 domain-containing protein [Akkermansiaceae bacterium]